MKVSERQGADRHFGKTEVFLPMIWRRLLGLSRMVRRESKGSSGLPAMVAYRVGQLALKRAMQWNSGAAKTLI